MSLPIASSSEPKERTHIFTFYSFKGGVGRSMAVINIAALLARDGRRVLIIDLDLEAPGITYLANEADETVPDQKELALNGSCFGFVDALYDLIVEGTKSPLGNKADQNPFAKYIRPLDLTDFAQAELSKGERVVVDLMPAGNLSNPPTEYRRRLSQIAFEERFRHGDAVPLLQHFKNLLRKATPEYDYILIDSRTGLSAEASAAVGYLADHLVVIMGLNRQNREGTAQFLSMLRAGKLCPKSLSLVISPLPIGEDELSDSRLSEAENAITKAWSPEKPIRAVALIPYHPRIALDERPHKRRRTNEHLSNAYNRLANRISLLTGNSARQLVGRFVEAINVEKWNDAANALSRLPRRQTDLHISLRNSPLERKVGEEEVNPVIRELERFVAEDKDAAYICALHFFRSGALSRAESVWESYVGRDWNDVQKWATAMRFWNDAADKPAIAMNLIENAIARMPTVVDFHRFAAIQQWDRFRDGQKAENYFRAALKINPADDRTHTTYANFLRENDRLRESENHYLKALELNPNQADWHGNIANLLWHKLKRKEEAKFHYQQALEIAPNDSVWLGNYAFFLWKALDSADEAELYYKRSLEINPDSAPWQRSYGFFLWKRRNSPDRAEEHYKKACDLEDEGNESYVAYGDFLVQERKEFAAAEKFYRKALEIEQGDVNCRLSLAETSILLARLPEAKEELEIIWKIELLEDKAIRLRALFAAAMLQILNGAAEDKNLGRIRTLIEDGDVEPEPDIEVNQLQILESAKSRLQVDDFVLYFQIIRVTSGEADTAILFKMPQWQKLVAHPLEGPLFA